MAVSSQVNSRTFVATGTATPVPIAFKWGRASDLIVTRLVAGEGSADDGGRLTMGSAYAIGGDGRANPPTGFLTEIALEAGRTYRIERATGALQKYEPRMAVAGNAGAMENQLDDMVMAHQDVRRDLADTATRSWMVPRGEQGGILPPAGERAGKFRAWDAAGNEVPASGTGGGDAALRGDIASEYGATLIGTEDGLTVEGKFASLFVAASDERYVHPATGNDASGDGSAGLPFKTIQRAYDSLPRLIERQATIWLMSGTVEAPTIFNENYLTGSSDKALFPRPAVLFARGRAILTRTQNNSGVMSAGVLIKPTGAKGTAIIEGTASLTYWAYIEACQIAFQSVVFRGASTMTSGNGCVVHRGGAYGHFYDCDWLANGFAVPYGVFAEAGGFTEITGLDSKFDGCSIGVGVSMGSNADIAARVLFRNCGTAVNIIQSQMSIQWNDYGSAADSIDATNTTALNATLSDVRFTGMSGGRMKVKAPVNIFGGGLTCVYTDFEAAITARGGFIHLNASNWSSQLTYSHTAILLQGANSYVAPATESAAQQPLRCEGGLPPATSGTVNIVPASGGRPQMLVGTFSPTANAQTLTPAINIESYLAVGSGGNRTGCTLGMSAATFEGAQLTLTGTGNSVEIVSSGTCDVPAAGIVIGNNSGNLTGASFVARSGRWRLVGIGGVR